MNENAKAWVAALRSGEYRQGAGSLQRKHGDRPDSFCCLGLACHLASEAGAEVRVDVVGNQVRYDNRTSYLPDSVRRWMGLSSDAGTFDAGTFGSGFGSLAQMNDKGSSFDEIAGRIESEPEGLFTTIAH